jgi:3-oxoacyl-[acyl-carrier-protein] synthase-1
MVTIVGTGVVSPVGLSAPSTCAALRAGVSGMRLFEGWADVGEAPDPPFPAGRTPLEWLQPDFPYQWPGHEAMGKPLPRPHVLVTPGPERLVELALPAAEEAWARAGFASQRGPGVGLYLGVDDADDPGPVSEALAGSLGLRFEIVRSDRLGRASGLAALHRAMRHLADGRVRVALVGGVDSLLRRAPVARLEEQGRLKMEDVPDGVIPGEAAAFLVLEAGGDRGHVGVTETALGEEETVKEGEPSRGVALSRSLARATRSMRDFPWVACDLNGERYRHLEWGISSVRALGHLRMRKGGPTETDVWHPADCTGDTGAASGILDAAWAVTALRKGYARTDSALVWGGSDGPLRAAALLQLTKS